MTYIEPLGQYGSISVEPSFAELLSLAAKVYTWEGLSTPLAEDGLATHRLLTSVTATLRNGEVYVKTYTYDTYGVVAAESRWTLQVPASSASMWFLWPWIVGNDTPTPPATSEQLASMWALWPWFSGSGSSPPATTNRFASLWFLYANIH